MPVKVENMADMMREIFRNDMLAEGMSPQEAEAMLEMMHADQVPLTVVTNEMKVNGASALFYPEVMDQLAEKIGGNFFILPSSVHESLVLPDDGSQSIGDLKAMVMEVNATQVDPVDRLSDDVYHYDAQDKVFEKAQDFESRMAEKVAVKDADRKPSLHQKLETKKQESKEQEPKMPKAEKRCRTLRRCHNMSTMNRYKAYTEAVASAKKEKIETKQTKGGKKSILARLQEAKK